DLPYDASAGAKGPLIPGQTAARQFSVTLPDGIGGAGDILVTITADIFNQAVEFNAAGTGESNNTASRTVSSTLAAYPDLQVTNLAVNGPAVLQSGDVVTIQWRDANTGTAAAPTNWADSLTVKNLSTGQTLGTALIPYDLASAGNGPIGPGDSRLRQYSFQIPEGDAGVGQIQFSLATDANNAFFEYN